MFQFQYVIKKIKYMQSHLRVVHNMRCFDNLMSNFLIVFDIFSFASNTSWGRPSCLLPKVELLIKLASLRWFIIWCFSANLVPFSFSQNLLVCLQLSAKAKGLKPCWPEMEAEFLSQGICILRKRQLARLHNCTLVTVLGDWKPR